VTAGELIALLQTVPPGTEVRTFANEGGSRTQPVGKLIPPDYQGMPDAVALDEGDD
jgi:hypothetical protein